MIPAFAKIWAVGSPEIKSTLFDGVVEVTEKIDGSQIGFGRTEDGRLMIRSKGAPIYDNGLVREPDKLFASAVKYIESIQERIQPGARYYGEVLCDKKHNTLTYGRVPRNNVLIYGCFDGHTIVEDYGLLNLVADRLGFDTVPLLYSGVVSDLSMLKSLLELDSSLGGTKIEGVVIKNYNKAADSKLSSYCFGKYVSERFKELNHATWAGIKKNSVDEFIDGFASEARWLKAVQHFAEDGRATHTVKDIGPLIEIIQRDVFEENTEFIKERLFKLFERQIRVAACRKFPEWFKERLAKESLCTENSDTNASTIVSNASTNDSAHTNA